MKPLPMVFRMTFAAALALGLANLTMMGLPARATDVHMLLGIIAVGSALGILWPGIRSGDNASLAGAALAAVLLVLGLGLRLGWWINLGMDRGAIGLVHLAVAVTMIAVVERTAAQARRIAAR